MNAKRCRHAGLVVLVVVTVLTLAVVGCEHPKDGKASETKSTSSTKKNGDDDEAKPRDDKPTPTANGPQPVPEDRFDLEVPSKNASAWKKAYKAYMGKATASATMLQDKGLKWRLQPLTDPGGKTIDGVFVVRIGKSTRTIAIAEDGKYVAPNAGPEAAAKFLAGAGFPSEPYSRELVGEVLRYYGVLPHPWYPTVHKWEDLDRYYTEQELPKPKLTVEGGQASYVVEATVNRDGSSGGAPGVVHKRRTITMTSKSLSVTDETKTSDGFKPDP